MPPSDENDFTSDGWVANYPPWYWTWLVKQAGCKTQKDGERLLHLMRSIEDGEPEDTRRLLAEGVNPNMRLSRKDGMLLEWAAEKTRNVDCLRALVEAGADSKARKVREKMIHYGWHELLGEAPKAGASATPPAFLPSQDFRARACAAGFKKAVTLVRKITSSSPVKVELEEGALAGAKAFPVTNARARTVLRKVRSKIQNLGAIAFLTENLISLDSSAIVLLPTMDYYEAIAAFETPVGQSLSTTGLIAWLKRLHRKQPFEITHIAPDLVRAEFATSIAEPLALAKSIKRICGDVINEPIGKVAAALQRSRELYLWWD
jgi:hypothetical protein